MHNYLTNPKLLNDSLKHVSETVLINGEKRQAVITTAYLGEAEKRHISSLEPFKAGDIVTYRGVDYLITQETQSKRHNKYRAAMEACNYYFTVRDYLGKVEIGRDPQGRPLYEEHYSDPYNVPGVLKKWERSNLDTAFAVTLMDITFFIDIQDNPKNREQFKVNNTYEIKGRTMQLIMIEESNEGIMGLLFLNGGATPPY